MFISDKKNAEKQVTSLLRFALLYLAAALFCALFGAVYERFSHEVYSFFMIYAFMIPLTLGTLPLLGYAMLERRRMNLQEKTEEWEKRRMDPPDKTEEWERRRMNLPEKAEKCAADPSSLLPAEWSKTGQHGETADTGYLFPDRFSLNAWNSGVAALTVGCIFRGVLEIYGTTNRLIIVYPAAAAILLCAGLASCLITRRRAQQTQ